MPLILDLYILGSAASHLFHVGSDSGNLQVSGRIQANSNFLLLQTFLYLSVIFVISCAFSPFLLNFSPLIVLFYIVLKHLRAHRAHLNDTCRLMNVIKLMLTALLLRFHSSTYCIYCRNHQKCSTEFLHSLILII